MMESTSSNTSSLPTPFKGFKLWGKRGGLLSPIPKTVITKRDEPIFFLTILKNSLTAFLFAHKGTAGWEALVNALVQAGWTVTNSWPIETERGARMRAKNSAVLASSVFLVCRPRPEGAGVGDWRRVLEEMNRKVAQWLPRLEQEGIHGADAVFACIGPALEVYSR